MMGGKSNQEPGLLVSAAPLPFGKRAFDMAVLMITLPVWLPLTVLVALAIRVGSAGPVIFRQERIGRGGTPFTCLKFRTMKLHADQGNHKDHIKGLIRSSTPMVKLDAEWDQRLTPGGRWIRAAGLDELPQIINIVRGEMSLVGPRPCIPYEYDLYEPWQRQRCAATPGLTGLWQVSGKNRTSFEEMVRLDIDYARRMSARLDAWILLRTPLAILQQIQDLRRVKRSKATSKPSSLFKESATTPVQKG